MLIWKQLFDWSCEDLDHDVPANLVYRVFTRVDASEGPEMSELFRRPREKLPYVEISTSRLLSSDHDR